MRSVDDSNDGNEDEDVDEVCILWVFMCVGIMWYWQGLLVEEDSSMDEGDPYSKVSVLCFICAVFLCSNKTQKFNKFTQFLKNRDKLKPEYSPAINV